MESIFLFGGLAVIAVVLCFVLTTDKKAQLRKEYEDLKQSTLDAHNQQIEYYMNSPLLAEILNVICGTGDTYCKPGFIRIQCACIDCDSVYGVREYDFLNNRVTPLCSKYSGWEQFFSRPEVQASKTPFAPLDCFVSPLGAMAKAINHLLEDQYVLQFDPKDPDCICMIVRPDKNF